jgi:hypothetical protein
VGSRSPPSVVVHDLDIAWSGQRPDKAYSPLVVDPNAVLALAVSFERFELVAWGRTQKVQSLRCVELRQLSLSNQDESLEPLRILSLEQRLGVLAVERPNHAKSVLRSA